MSYTGLQTLATEGLNIDALDDASGAILEAVAAERVRIGALVEAVRDANRDAEDGNTFRLLRPGQERAWMALLAGLNGTTSLPTSLSQPGLTMNSNAAEECPALSDGLGVLPEVLTVAAYNAGNDVMIEAVKQTAGPELWAVRYMGEVLNKRGEWEYEPLPSNRDDAFRERCRFATPAEAYERLKHARLNG
jgi:hypothetical protein